MPVIRVIGRPLKASTAIAAVGLCLAPLGAGLAAKADAVAAEAQGFTLPDVPPTSRFTLRGVMFEGNTVYDDQTLTAAIADFIGQAVDSTALAAMQVRLNQVYADGGHIASGVLLPDQDVAGGTVRFKVIEGRLADVRVDETRRVAPGYVRNRLLKTPTPLTVDGLEARFERLLADPAIDRMQAQVRPGATAGEAVLDVVVSEPDPVSLTFGIDNYRPPATGAESVLMAIAFNNLTGWGDQSAFSANVSESVFSVEGEASLPMTADDTRIVVAASSGDSLVVETDLRALDIDSRNWSVGLGLEHPIVRTPDRSLTVSASLERANSRTFLLGRPFSFDEGAENGRTDVTALRFETAYQSRTPDRVVAAQGTASLGVDMLGASNFADRPDSQFGALLAQAQYVRRLGESDTGSLWGLADGPLVLTLRGAGQLADDALPSLERFAVGGRYTVRGYRENSFVRDNGLTLTAEMAVPIGRLSLDPEPGAQADARAGEVALVPFVDVGLSWRHDDGFGNRETAAAVGLGITWRPVAQVEAEVFYGHALVDPPDAGSNLQDEGFHVGARFRPFL